MVNEYERRVGDKVLIAEMDTGSYDWSSFGLFRDDAGRLYTAEDGGCSCTSPWEDPEYLDFDPVPSIHAAIARASRIRDADKYNTYSQADYDSFVKEALEA